MFRTVDHKYRDLLIHELTLFSKHADTRRDSISVTLNETEEQRSIIKYKIESCKQDKLHIKHLLSNMKHYNSKKVSKAMASAREYVDNVNNGEDLSTSTDMKRCEVCLCYKHQESFYKCRGSGCIQACKRCLLHNMRVNRSEKCISCRLNISEDILSSMVELKDRLNFYDTTLRLYKCSHCRKERIVNKVDTLDPSTNQTYHCPSCSKATCITHCKKIKKGSCPVCKKNNLNDQDCEQYINTFTKKCPNCKASTEKNGGCNHMSCSACSFQYCWECLGEYQIQCFGCN